MTGDGVVVRAGHGVLETTGLHRLCERDLILPDQQQRERREVTERRKAAFVDEPTGRTELGVVPGRFRVRDHHWRGIAVGWSRIRMLAGMP